MTVTRAVVFCLLVVLTRTAYADDEAKRRTAAEGNPRTLRGLPGVCVLVEHLGEDAERGGLNRTTIQTDVELQLRLAGIRVLTAEESLEALSSPCLYVQVLCAVSREGPATLNGLYVCSVRVGVYQAVRLTNGESTMAETWEAPVAGVGTVGPAYLGRGVRDEVNDGVNEFINAWLAVNPRK